MPSIVRRSVRDAVDYWENTTPLCSAVGTMGLQRNRTGSNPGSQETSRQEEGHDDSARWSSREEFLRGLDSAPLDFSEPMSAGGFPLGVFDGRVYFDTGDSHTIVFGSTGSKKTLSVSMPAIRIIAHSGESAVVLDPKGDQLRTMGRELVSLGYPVYVVNARDPSRSHRWNMLRLPYELSRSDDFGDRDMAQNLVANLAEVLSPVVDKDPYWNMSAQSLIVGLCSVLFNVCSDPSKINLRSLCKLKDLLMDEDCALTYYLKDEALSSPEERLAVRVTDTSDVTRRCIFGMFDQSLRPLVSQDAMAWLTSDSDFDFKDLGLRKGFVFIVTPDEDGTYDMLGSMMITQCYKQLVTLAQESPGIRLPVRVNFICDEFGNLPTIPSMLNIITASRSRNIRFLLLLQDKSQLVRRYGDVAASIISNCSNVMYLNGRDVRLIGELSELSGRDRSGSLMVSTSRLQRLSKEDGEVFVLRDRMYPYISRLVDIHGYANLAAPDFGMEERERSEVPVFSMDDFSPRRRPRVDGCGRDGSGGGERIPADCSESETCSEEEDYDYESLIEFLTVLVLDGDLDLDDLNRRVAERRAGEDGSR